MTASSVSLSQLGKTISECATALEELLEQQKLPKPSFHHGGLLAYPHTLDFLGLRSKLTDALSDLQVLALGPFESFGLPLIADIYHQAALNIFNEFDVWDAIPLEGTTPTEEVAKKTGLSVEVISRSIMHSSTKHLFWISASGAEVAHTARSATFVLDPKLRGWVSHHMRETWPSAVNLPVALRKWHNDTETPNKTAAAVTLFGDEPTDNFWTFIDKPAERARLINFGNAMEFTTKNPAFDLVYLVELFDWKSLGAVKLVDIGGSKGHASVALAAQLPDATFVIQDFAALETGFNATVPAHLKSRFTFQAHNFFNPQPVKDADVYLLKHILHDWSDPWAAKIIQQIVPVMTKPNARLLICDGLLPEKDTVPGATYGMLSGLDMHMMAMLNAKERSAKQWEALLHLADPKLELVAIHAVPQSAFALVEAKLAA